MGSIISSRADGKMLNVLDVNLIQNALRYPNSHLPLSSVDFGFQFEEQAKKSVESGNLNNEQLHLIKQRSSQFLFRLCLEMCKRLPDNLHIIDKVKYLSPVECFNPSTRQTFSQLPIELAGMYL